MTGQDKSSRCQADATASKRLGNKLPTNSSSTRSFWLVVRFCLLPPSGTWGGPYRCFAMLFLLSNARRYFCLAAVEAILASERACLKALL